MIIKIITREPFPNGRAASCRIRNLALGLSENGYKCEIVVTRRTETSKQNRYNTDYKGRLSNNITYEYLTRNTLVSSRIKSTIQNIFEPLQAFIHCIKSNDSDTIVIFYGQKFFIELFIGLSCAITKSVFCKDLVKYPYLKDEKPTIKSWIVIHILFKVYKSFIVISDDLEEIANKYKRAKSKIVRIPILLNTNKVCNQTTHAEKKYIFHSGSLTENKDGFCGILEVFGKTRLMSNTDIDLYVTGQFDSITNKELATQIIEKYELQNHIKFLGYIKEDDVLMYQKGSLFFWINMHDTTTNKYCFPTKLGEYLFSGNPVIITDVGIAPKYLENNESAYIVPDDTEAMVTAAVRILNNPKEAKCVGSNGKAIAIKHFDCCKQCQRLASFFLDLLNGNEIK